VIDANVRKGIFQMNQTSDPKPPEGEAVVPEPASVDSAGSDDPASLDASAEPGSDPATVQQRNGFWLAWLALLSAFAALTLALWSAWLTQGVDETATDPALGALESRLASAERSVRELSDDAARTQKDRVDAAEFRSLEARLLAAEQAATNRPSDPALEMLVRRVEQVEAERARDLAALRDRLSQIEQAAAAGLGRFEQQLAALGDEAASGNDRVEAERQALVRIEELLVAGRDRLELFGDAESARKVWGEAVIRLERMESSAFGSLLQRLRAERDALAAVSSSDRAAIVSVLLGASSEVGEWRVAGDETSERRADAATDVAAETRWRARFGRVFDRLVRVERLDIEHLDPAELDSARRSVAALLETLALAVARRDDAVAARLAAVAERRIRRLFDSGDAPVGALIQRLGTLANPQQISELPLNASGLELRRLIEARQ